MKNLIEATYSIGLIINALLFLLQAIKIIRSKDASSISFGTFFGFLIIQFTSVAHGYLHNDVILTWGTLLNMLTCGYVVILVIYYKNKGQLKNRVMAESL